MCLEWEEEVILFSSLCPFESVIKVHCVAVHLLHLLHHFEAVALWLVSPCLLVSRFCFFQPLREKDCVAVHLLQCLVLVVEVVGLEVEEVVQCLRHALGEQVEEVQVEAVPVGPPPPALDL